MEKELLESLKGKGREERLAYFSEHKSDLIDESLTAVNGGADTGLENPDSECPYKRSWYTSFGWVCAGVRTCD